VQANEELIFVLVPGLLADVGVQVVVPPFTALLANTAWQE
jgi:hypothetical protein